LINQFEEQAALFDLDPKSSQYEYKQSLEKISIALTKYGLTTGQSKIFIFLGKYGSKTAREICKGLDFARTATYPNLSYLQNMGIIMAEFSHPTKFSAVPLEKAIVALVNQKFDRVKSLAHQKEKLVDMWNKIPFFLEEKNESKSEKLQMLEGTSFIHNKIIDMIQTAKEDFRIFGSVKDFSSLYHADFLKKLDESRLDLKLLISPASRLPFFVEDVEQKKIKIMANTSKENQFFLVKDSDEVLIFLRNINYPKRSVFAFWANSRSLVSLMKSLFDLSWHKSRVVN